LTPYHPQGNSRETRVIASLLRHSAKSSNLI
jgi:hypothetical protein